jgi:hypothetical protein
LALQTWIKGALLGDPEDLLEVFDKIEQPAVRVAYKEAKAGELLSSCCVCPELLQHVLRHVDCLFAAHSCVIPQVMYIIVLRSHQADLRPP